MLKVVFPVWLFSVYALHIKKRNFFKFIVGYIGFFLIAMFVINLLMKHPLKVYPFAIEIIAFIGLLIFFPLRRKWITKVSLLFIGPLYIFGYSYGINYLKIVLNDLLVYPFNNVVNEILARLASCCFIIILYYVTFTKPHILSK